MIYQDSSNNWTAQIQLYANDRASVRRSILKHYGKSIIIVFVHPPFRIVFVHPPFSNHKTVVACV